MVTREELLLPSESTKSLPVCLVQCNYVPRNISV